MVRGMDLGMGIITLMHILRMLILFMRRRLEMDCTMRKVYERLKLYAG